MNDDFLKHLRAEPPPAFANDLRKRLARQQRQSGAGSDQGELVMTTPNNSPTVSRAAGRRRTLVWSALAVGAAITIFALGALLGRATPQTPTAAATSPFVGSSASASAGAAQQAGGDASTAPSAAASAATFSTTPAGADALAAVDLDALLTQDDLLPTGYAVLGRPSKRVPDVFRAVPEPVQVRAANLTSSGVSVGNITVLLYAATAERDQAFEVLARRTISNFVDQVYESDGGESYPGFTFSPVPLAGVGERATGQSAQSTTTNTINAPTSGALQTFVRCGAVVHVRLASTTTRDDLQLTATEIAQALDQQLVPQVCQAP